jgi:hypothetical protein
MSGAQGFLWSVVAMAAGVISLITGVTVDHDLAANTGAILIIVAFLLQVIVFARAENSRSRVAVLTASLIVLLATGGTLDRFRAHNLERVGREVAIRTVRDAMIDDAIARAMARAPALKGFEPGASELELTVADVVEQAVDEGEKKGEVLGPPVWRADRIDRKTWLVVVGWISAPESLSRGTQFECSEVDDRLFVSMISSRTDSSGRQLDPLAERWDTKITELRNEILAEFGVRRSFSAE